MRDACITTKVNSVSEVGNGLKSSMEVSAEMIYVRKVSIVNQNEIYNGKW